VQKNDGGNSGCLLNGDLIHVHNAGTVKYSLFYRPLNNAFVQIGCMLTFRNLVLNKLSFAVMK
jgi:hypothetical protein